jgi:hypothetical protein
MMRPPPGAPSGTPPTPAYCAGALWWTTQPFVNVTVTSYTATWLTLRGLFWNLKINFSVACGAIVRLAASHPALMNALGAAKLPL